MKAGDGDPAEKNNRNHHRNSNGFHYKYHYKHCTNIRASMLLRETAMHKRSEVHAVQGTRDFSQNCSGCICSKLPSLKWHREDKMAHLHHFLLEAHSQIHYRLTQGENALMHIHTSSRTPKRRSSLSIWLAGMSRN